MSTLYVATGDCFACLTPQEGSASAWTVRTSLHGSAVHCLAVDPGDPQTVYCGSASEGIWKTSDGGGRWANVTPEMGEAGIYSLAISAANGAIYAGCEPSMLWVSQDGGRNWEELENLRLIPSAPTWSFPPRSWTSRVRSIAPNPHHADWLLVGIEQGGVMFSTDGGWSWDDHREAAHRDVHALAWHPTSPARAYQTAGEGCAESVDGGWSWQPVNEGLDWNCCSALVVDPNDADCWFVSAAPDEANAQNESAQAALYRRRKQGEWEKKSGGLPEPFAMPYALAIDQSTLWTGLANGEIWYSHDRGDSWQKALLLGDELDGIRALACVDDG